jgi:hypothetical protein
MTRKPTIFICVAVTCLTSGRQSRSRNGLALFEQAIARDPKFALGHAGIADAYILLGEYGTIPVEGAAEKAWPEVFAA